MGDDEQRPAAPVEPDGRPRPSGDSTSAVVTVAYMAGTGEELWWARWWVGDVAFATPFTVVAAPRGDVVYVAGVVTSTTKVANRRRVEAAGPRL